MARNTVGAAPGTAANVSRSALMLRFSAPWLGAAILDRVRPPEAARIGSCRRSAPPRRVRQQRVGAFEVVRLPRREGEAGRVAERVDQGVDLRAQAAFAAPGRLPAPAAFLGAPALCRWARTIVLSIMAYSLSASPAKCLKTRSHMPVLAQRQKRVWTFFQAPNRSGRSRQGMPARYR